MQSRVTPKMIHFLYENGLCFFLVNKEDTDIVGFGALWPTKKEGWYELGSLWVHPEFRQRGDGWIVFERTIKLAPKKSVLFLITRSIKVVHMAKYCGWDEAPSWHDSIQWKKVCEPWEPTPKKRSSTRIFPKEGRLFYSLTSS